MQTLTTITSGDPNVITSLVRDLTHATISPMPRRDRTVPDTPVLQALDEAVREYDEAEALLKAKDTKLREAIVEAAREAADKDSRLTIQHIAERVGWTRETINRIATKAGVRQRAARSEKAHDAASGT
ncbi:hypothetical protein FHR83_006658 [Actinoplanes campanulatus]|uniref:Uncharacterized protein n=1 Tax=Actinoplanes campanulatus TaxID=113559 RepID=A0A7W5FHZ0_9ACTN|nr:hypothetical protein [Actinoplanes campanulatus]MBB3098952.1 hypothetical protein [Actinoplanes campanulatus]